MSNEILQKANDLLQKGDVLGAIEYYEELTQLMPDNPRYISDLSGLYDLSRQHEKAYKTFLKIWNEKTGKLKDETNAAAIDFARAGEHAYYARHIDQAIANLEKSLALAPANHKRWCFLGRCHSSAGNRQAAQKAFDQAIEINPSYFPAYYYLSRISGFKKGDPAFATLEGYKKDQSMPTAAKADLGFALGRMYQDSEEFDKAFENFSLGNASAHQQSAALGYTFNHADHEQGLNLITALYSPENRKKIQYKGSASEKPVFIVGMQRSGTTLLEQIMAAHSEISSAGELVQLAANHQELMAWVGQFNNAAREQAFQKAIDESAENMTAMFLGTLEDKGEDTPLIIDKLPQNFIQLGLIQVLFPNAKVIHIRRDPMDVGLSIFASQFSADLSFANDLGDIGFYIRKYRDLMAEWKKILDLPIHEIEYEALVNDPETVVRGVIEFCGLEWQPECLEFYKKPGKVFTSSVMQVREPISKSAIGKWKAFEKHLGPLKAALEG